MTDRSWWRWFPWMLVAALLLVVAVNGGLIYAAMTSFPGKAANDGFDLSNRYNIVMAEARRETALGWNVAARAEPDGRPMVTVSDSAGAPLRDVVLTAVAERPLGAPHMQQLGFREAAAGRYVADAALPERGQWDVTLTASMQGNEIRLTRRIIVR